MAVSALSHDVVDGFRCLELLQGLRNSRMETTNDWKPLGQNALKDVESLLGERSPTRCLYYSKSELVTSNKQFEKLYPPLFLAAG
jgi:hypothetical protein